MIVSYPPPFLGEKSMVYWFSGRVVKVVPEDGFAFAVKGDLPTDENRAKGICDNTFPNLEFIVSPYENDGFFGIRF